MNHAKMNRLGLIALSVAATLGQSGCDGTSGGGGPDGGRNYRLEGAAVKDPALGYLAVSADLTSEGAPVYSAEIKFGPDQLTLRLDSAFYQVVRMASAYPSGNYHLYVRDSTLLNDSIATRLPGDFQIETVLPATGEKRSIDVVTLDWSPSSVTDGYVMAAVKRTSAYSGAGFSQYVTSGATAGTYPNEAFSLPSGDPDTGMYDLYVYSYVGSPDSILARVSLPVPMPSRLVDNIARKDVEGRFGTVVVTPRGSIRVTQQ
ncbi:MAG TPA: hypothetical protein VN285_05995 [Candidatus Deferrimicrobium sp.]|nr:hypothetical protein [Candidatus Deferrimicrobium sp.]